MNDNRACYDYNKIIETITLIKNTNWSVKHKAEHFAKYCEIKNIYEFASDNINKILFDPKIELKEYGRAAFEHKMHTKKELDRLLKNSYYFICNEIRDIIRMMKTGEVDSINLFY